MLALSLADTIRKNVEASICTNQSFAFGGQQLTQSGQYRDYRPGGTACDTLVTLTLTVDAVIRSPLQDSICAGSNYAFGTQTLTESGSYTRTLASSAGCDSIITLQLFVRPPLSGQESRSLCPGDVISLGGQEFRQTGTFTLTLVSSIGCDSIVQLSITPGNCGGLLLVGQPSPTRCFGESTGQITLNLAPFTAPLQLSWQGLDGGSSGTLNFASTPSGLQLIPDLPAGRYRCSVVDANGQSASIELLVTSPTQLIPQMSLSLQGSYGLACAGDQNAEVSLRISGGTPPYISTWANGAQGLTLAGLASGYARVEIVDANGCRISDEILVTEPDALSFDLSSLSLRCDDLTVGGIIEVGNLSGGQPPYSFVLGEGEAGSQSAWSDLDPGQYLVTVSDAVACDSSLSVSITAPETPKLDLGADQEIFRGDTVRLRLRSTLTLDSFQWTASGGYLSCSDCLSPKAAPTETSTYKVLAWTPEGCIGEAELRLLVRIARGVFVPTAFSPNGDANNDGFTVFVEDEGARVEALEVYDRWGELMWARRDFKPGDVSLGWDGTYRGEEMDPAVFVYWARISFSDGHQELVKGDVTLMR